MDRGESLQMFLTETFDELSGKFKEFNSMVANFSTDDASMNTLLDSVLTCWHGIDGIMERFKTELSKRNLIKDTLMVPTKRFLQNGSWKRDSGIDTVSSSGSPFVSANRLSTSDDDNDTTESRVTFNLQSVNTSFSDFTEEFPDNQPEQTHAAEISTVYIHIMPADQTTDLSVLREKIRDLSRSTLKSDNVELHLVPSDSFIGITSRHSSVSSGGLNSVRTSRQTSTSSDALHRGRLPSSNDSLSAALFNLAQKIPEEHTDSSDDQRFVSSSDSEISVMRHNVSIEPRSLGVSMETQTDFENYGGVCDSVVQISVETQTE